MILARMLIVASVLGAASLLAETACPATQQSNQRYDRPQSRQEAVTTLFTIRFSELLKMAPLLALKS